MLFLAKSKRDYFLMDTNKTTNSQNISATSKNPPKKKPKLKSQHLKKIKELFLDFVLNGHAQKMCIKLKKSTKTNLKLY